MIYEHTTKPKARKDAQDEAAPDPQRTFWRTASEPAEKEEIPNLDSWPVGCTYPQRNIEVPTDRRLAKINPKTPNPKKNIVFQKQYSRYSRLLDFLNF